MEVQLAPARATPDLSVLLAGRSQIARALEILEPPHWRALLAGWARRRDPRIASFWLEFDLSRSRAAVPAPSLCVKLRGPVDGSWVLDSLLPTLRGRSLARRQRQAAARCLREIPATAQLLYAFSLLPRGGDLRLELFGLAPREMGTYLKRIEAPVHPAEVARAASLFEGVERTHLSFDLGAQQVRPRVGIEGAFPGLPRREPRWGALLDRLAGAGLCTAAQRAALFAWPGWDSFWTAPDLWPADPRWMGAFCVRYLSHVKVVWQPGRTLEAKAYLAFQALRRGNGVRLADQASAAAPAAQGGLSRRAPTSPSRRAARLA